MADLEDITERDNPKRVAWLKAMSAEECVRRIASAAETPDKWLTEVSIEFADEWTAAHGLAPWTPAEEAS